MITSVDEKELLAWMGTKSDTRENAADVKKEMEKQKGHLLEALAAKGDALIKSKHYYVCKSKVHETNERTLQTNEQIGLHDTTSKSNLFSFPRKNILEHG